MGERRDYEPEEEITGPVQVPVHTCGFHQRIHSDISVAKWRLDDMREEIVEMKSDAKEAHVAMMSAIEQHRCATRETFGKQQAALEELRVSAGKMSTKLVMALAVAAAVGSAALSVVVKLIGE